MKKLLLKTLIFLFLSHGVFASEVPQVVAENFETPFLIGSASVRFVGFKVYDVALWSEDKDFSYEKKFAIFVLYKMGFSSEALAKRSIEEIEKLHALSDEEHEDYLGQLTKIFNSVKKGDEKVAMFLPGKGVEMFYNGKLNGKITDPKLARLFVDIWLDEKGSYPKETKKILGK